MTGTIGPGVVHAAVALRRSHPHVAAFDVIDVVMRGRSGRLRDFGDATRPGAAFGQLIAAALDDSMSPID